MQNALLNAVEAAVLTYWDDVKDPTWGALAEKFFAVRFKDASAGPCRGVLWTKYSAAAKVALARRARSDQFWRIAHREVTVYASTRTDRCSRHWSGSRSWRSTSC